MFRMMFLVIALVSAQAMADTYSCVLNDTGKEVIIEASSYEILVIQDKQEAVPPVAECVPHVTYTNAGPSYPVWHLCD